MTVAAWWYVVGLTLDPDITPADAERFDTFYRDVHAPEVLRHNAGFTGCTRWRVTRRDPATEPGPDRLACYSLAGESAVDGYLNRSAGPRPTYTPKPDVWHRHARPLWRGFWRTTGPAGECGSGPIGLSGGSTPAAGRPWTRFVLHHDMSAAAAPRFVALHGVDERCTPESPWRLVLTPAGERAGR